uniref:Zinc finger protein 865 n=1 Tax=Cacopsylla melanoneura TaxID=428564 RepID=A0A8D8SHB0_9HEMI
MDSSSMLTLDCQTSEYFPSEDCVLPSQDGELYQVECHAKDNENNADESVEVVEVGLDLLDGEDSNNVHNDSEDTMDAFETDNMNPDALLIDESPITTLENFKLEVPNEEEDPIIHSYNQISNEEILENYTGNTTEPTNQDYTDTVIEHHSKNEHRIQNDIILTEDTSQEYIIAEASIEDTIESSYDNTEASIEDYKDSIQYKTEVANKERIITEDRNEEFIIAEDTNEEYIATEESSVPESYHISTNEIPVQDYNFAIDTNTGVQNYVFCVDDRHDSAVVSGDNGDIVYETDDQTVLHQNYEDGAEDDNILEVVINEEESSSDQVQLNTELTEEETLLNIDESWIEEEEIEANDPSSESYNEEQINEMISRTRKPGRKKRRRPNIEEGDDDFKDIRNLKNILGEELSRIESLSTFRTELRGTRQKNTVSNKTRPSSPPPGSYQCSECGKHFTRKFSLNAHLSVHFGMSNYKCPLCDKYFIQMCHLKDHIRAHGGLTPFGCSYCEKRFTRQSDLKRHLQQHMGVKYSCDICSKMFTSQHGLRYHLKAHKGLKPYVCEICNKAYALRTSLLSHAKTHHSTTTGPSSDYSTLVQNALSSSSPSTTKNSLGSRENSHTVQENSLIVRENPIASSFHHSIFQQLELVDQEQEGSENPTSVNYIEYRRTPSPRLEGEEEESDPLGFAEEEVMDVMVKEEVVVEEVEEEDLVDVIGEEIEI